MREDILRERASKQTRSQSERILVFKASKRERKRVRKRESDRARASKQANPSSPSTLLTTPTINTQQTRKKKTQQSVLKAKSGRSSSRLAEQKQSKS